MIRRLLRYIYDSGLPIKRWQRILSAYKKRHTGTPCLIIGNGPSVRAEDLMIINDLDCVTFVCNRFHKIYTNIDFQPDYTVAIDPLFLSDFGEELVSEHRGDLFIGHHKQNPQFEKAVWFKIKASEPFHFSLNPLKHTQPGGSVIVAALQLAFFMGCREFYLYGIDHKFSFDDANVEELAPGGGSFTVTGEHNHFIDNYRGGKSWAKPCMSEIEAAFAECHRLIEFKKGKLYNASRVSELSTIPRIEFEKFVQLVQ